MARLGPEVVELELSRPFQIAQLGDKAAKRNHRVDITASKAEGEALALRFDLLAVDRLVANLVLNLDPMGNLVVKGRIEAAVVQRCVTTLEPVPARLGDDFELVFSKEDVDEADRQPALPEPWPGETLDLGEIAAQQLGLALDPYPRSAGAAVVLGDDTGQERPEGTHRPFSTLAKLRDSLSGKA